MAASICLDPTKNYMNKPYKPIESPTRLEDFSYDIFEEVHTIAAIKGKISINKLKLSEKSPKNASDIQNKYQIEFQYIDTFFNSCLCTNYLWINFKEDVRFIIKIPDFDITIETLKIIIQKSHYFNINDFKLIYNGKIMREKYTLNAFKISCDTQSIWMKFNKTKINWPIIRTIVNVTRWDIYQELREKIKNKNILNEVKPFIRVYNGQFIL
tara:strand:+ start:238 stop:873 length:636 start_codon:yes stop_codon:yes gene_type:complete